MSEVTSSNASDFSTPMMKQYLEIKKQYPDCLLFFRLGDFYELFMEDAKIGAHILGITLTSREKGKDGRIPMAGVPYHAVDSYLSKLVKAGHKVAICEQTSTPDGKGIVSREVTRIVTPGTVLDERTLDKKSNNYLVSISITNTSIGIAYADISTGDFYVSQFESKDVVGVLSNELTRMSAAECILPEKLYADFTILRTLKKQPGLNIFCFYDWNVFVHQARELLKKQFGVTTLKGFGIDDKDEGIKAAAALLGYLQNTQKEKLSHITSIKSAIATDFVQLDRSTILNLELFSTLTETHKKASLIYHLDQTKTAMGGRLLRNWLLQPLTSPLKIEERLTFVENFLNSYESCEDIREKLQEVLDIERIVSRLSVGIGNARDLIGLKVSLLKIIEIVDLLQHTLGLEKFVERFTLKDLTSTVNLINTTINDEPPIDTKSGGIIKTEVNTQLDHLKNTISGSKEWLEKLEKEERIRTGISSLKVKFNQVFGFYIEISNANRDKVPLEYIRKQTLVNAERYITPELKKQEELVLTAEEKINALEFQLFLDVVRKILEAVKSLQTSAKIIGEIDCLATFAHLAKKHNYRRPQIADSTHIYIKEGRHPVVENILEDAQFVPNDVELSKDAQLLLITGPNMGGKSVYIRQVAIITLMMHMGSFVPADEAKISIVDRIFVRSGASDIMALGLSTFMVEMVETATILHNATSRSLVILDEIGRGTSTYDGLSLAWAITEYLVSNEKSQPLTLFATHYHELQVLAENYSHIKNFQVAVEQSKNDLVFLHKVIPGGTSHSYGIAVAKLAGIPADVIHRSIEVLGKLESQEKETPKQKISLSTEQLTFLKNADHPVLEELKTINTDSITPIEALQILARLRKKV